MNANTLLADPAAVRIEKFVSLDDSILIVVEAIQPTAICPHCRVPSGSLKARYHRRLADLPWHNVPVRIELHTRKFRCRNQLCPQKVFCERFEKLAAPFARRTNRLAQVIELLAFSLGARPGARATSEMFFPVGKDVFLRAARKAHHQPEVTKVRVLGVDDFAFRRGTTYGTILVDLESRQPIDLLPDRTAETLKTWLKAHPELEIVSRDRSVVYAEAVKSGSPHAAQVADRWHLLKNLSELVERFFLQNHCFLTEAAAEIRADERAKQTTISAEEENAGKSGKAEKPVSPRRQKLFDLIKELQAAGKSKRAIARELNIARNTVRRYIGCECVPRHRSGAGRKSVVVPFAGYLKKRWKAGEHNGFRLWQEIKERGFRGEIDAVQRFVRRWRENEVGNIPCSISARGLAPRRATKLLLNPELAKNEDEQNYLAKLCEIDPAVQAVQSLGCVDITI